MTSQFPPERLHRGKLRDAFMAAGRVLGSIVYRYVPERRRVAIANVARAFPAVSAEARAVLVRDSFRHAGMGVAETLQIWCFPTQGLDRFEITGGEHVDAGIASGRGVIVVQAHFGCMDVAAPAVCARWSVTAVSGHIATTASARWVHRCRERILTRVIRNDKPFALLRTLKRGEILWLSPDIRTPLNRGGLATTLFEQPVLTASTPARLAALTGATVIPFLPIRSTDGSRYRLCFEEPLCLDPDIGRATQQINDRFETQIRAHPEQYLWSNRRFERGRPRRA